MQETWPVLPVICTGLLFGTIWGIGAFTDGPMAGWEWAVVNYRNQMHREVHEK
jgi:hypothetical protein